ncbi:Sensor histidine kinase desK [Mycobacteroides abscessus subsp. abscessus]|nr:Sensor histidine kinase desK [Mycobacteroides abscessus subsp. abscessus]
MGYLDLIKNMHFSPPPRTVTGSLAVGYILLALYDAKYFKSGVADGVPPLLFIIVPISYLLTIGLTFFRSPLAIGSLWVLLIALHFNPHNDEFWRLAAIFSTAIIAYSMSAWFWLPTVAIYIYYFAFGMFQSASTDSVQILLGTLGNIIPFIVVPIVARLQVERNTAHKVAYEQRLEAAYHAADEERRNLARELHDVVAHELTVIAMQARTARYADADGKDEILGLIGTQSRTALQELRRLLAVMRVEKDSKMLAPEHQSMSSDLRETVLKQVKQLENFGYNVTYDIDGDFSQVPKSFAPTLSRVVTESVTNTIKHGRAGGDVEVHLSASDHALEYSLTNDTGKTKDQLVFPSSGFGLLGLTERVKPLGGTLESHSLPGDRWIMDLKMPFEA